MSVRRHLPGVSRRGSTLLSVVLAALLTLAAYTDPLLVGAAVVVVQVLIALAPHAVDGRGRSVRSSHLVTVLAAGAVATCVALAPALLDGANGRSRDLVGASDSGLLAGIMPAVVVAVFFALGTQLLRRDGRPEVVASTAYAVTLGALAALTSGWIGAARSLGGAEVVAVGAAGLVTGLLVWAVPLDRWLCACAAIVAGGGAGAAVAANVDSAMTWVFGVAVGSGVSLFAVLGQVLGRAWSRGRAHASAEWGFPGALPIALAAPLVYIGGQLIGAPGL